MTSKARLVASSGFVVRIPLLSAHTLNELQPSMPAALLRDADLRQLRVAHEQELMALAARCTSLLEDEVADEAIFIASPSLHGAVRRWLEQGADDDSAASMTRSLLSYFARMSARPTPFGLFASCSPGRFDDRNCTRSQGRAGLRRSTRLDFGFVTGVVDQLEAMDGVRQVATYYPNSSLYLAGGHLRMAERRVDRARVRYHRVLFDNDEALRTALRAAREGATTEEIALSLVDQEITLADAREYVEELIDAQVLLPDLGPAVTGPDAVGRLIAKVREVAQALPIAQALADAESALRDLDEKVLGSGLECYAAVVSRLQEIEPELDTSRLFQVDTTTASGLTLTRRIADEVAKGVSLLHQVGASDHDALADFRQRFTGRYEDREIPLVEVLDEEVGLGFGGNGGPAIEGAPLLADLPRAAEAASLEQPAWQARREAHLLRLVLDAVRSGHTEIQLTPTDLDKLADPRPRPMPDALSAMVTLLGKPEDLDSDNFRTYVQYASGPSGAEILGRFAHADDGIRALVQEQVEREQALRPDAIFAEIVHLPEGRVGNILARPVVRDHEIPFLGQSGAPRTAQIPIDDLLLSIRGNRLVLRSRVLAREVLPRLTSAHNHSRSALATYRFLAAVQAEGTAGALTWSWGSLQGAPFLPRVSVGRLILQRARWLLSADESAALVREGSSLDRFVAVQELRVRRQLPQWVVVGIADNELPVNLTSAAGCELLHQQLKRGAQVLHERLADEDQLCFGLPEGSPLAHELVVPFTKSATEAATPPVLVGGLPSVDVFAADFLPGSQWLTAKLYVGQAGADEVLRNLVHPFVSSWRARGLGDSWFFLRYGDPDWHLRIRFHGESQENSQVLGELAAACQPYFEDGRIARMQIDTYRREVARYGGPAGVVLSERLFQGDSDCVLALLAEPGSDELTERWKVALVGVDRLLGDFQFPAAARQSLVRRWREAMTQQQGEIATSARKLAGNVMRRDRAELEALVYGEPSTARELRVAAALDARSDGLRGIVSDLAALQQQGSLLAGLEDLAGSYCHMFVNRLLRGAQPMQELVIYDLLDRIYSAAAGRATRPA